MKVYDKAQWHIDGGENAIEVVARFKDVFDFLNRHELLSEDGKELLDSGIDSSISLHERLVTEEGAKFLEDNYDTALGEETVGIGEVLETLY